MMRSPAPGPAPLLIRADATPRMGTGHVMRCLALAQAWRRRGRVVFASSEVTPALVTRLGAEGFGLQTISERSGGVEDAQATARIARELGAAWTVVDGYQFDFRYQQALQQAGLKVLLLDDHGQIGEYAADVVLDQNLGTDPAFYVRRSDSTRLLLGTRYVLLREEFAAWQRWERRTSDFGRKVLVTMGGSDPDNVGLRVAEALGNLPVEARFVVGGSNPHLGMLQRKVRLPSAVLRDVSRMSVLMAWADLAVSAAGSTAWELACLGVPSLLLTLAPNQVGVAEHAERARIGLNLGDAATLDAARLSSAIRELAGDRATRLGMSAAGRRLVDGRGAARVVRSLLGPGLTLRRAEWADARLVWEWANEPAARAVSFHTAAIPWSDHERWFAGKLSDLAVRFYLGTDTGGAPLGLIRFDLDGERAVVSVNLAVAARGRGFGVALVERGIEQLWHDSAARRIEAFIKPSNTASVRVFEQAGFVADGTVEVRGAPALRLVLSHPSVS